MAPRWLDLLTTGFGPSPSVSTPLPSSSSSSASPLHRFRDQRAANPHWTDSQLLNANNRTPFASTADVVVGGGGIIGLIYAIHLKSVAPQLDVAVFEKSAAPHHKIGESTLSSFTRFLHSDVVAVDYLLRLFGVKDGLDFVWLDEAGSKPIAQDVGNLDVSLQLDRRVSELFLTLWAQKLGVRVYHGVGVDYHVDIPTATDSVVQAIALQDAGRSLGAGNAAIDARYVCDASGFACRLTSQVGAKQSFGGWNTDAVWGYFKPLAHAPEDHDDDDELPDWDYAATKHVCFADGWGWFITLISWHKAPLANLMDLLAHVIDLAVQRTPLALMPSTTQLSRQFDCPFEFITSVGFAVRDDSGTSKANATAEQRFLAIQQKYPVLDRLLTQRYALLPGYYNGRSFFQRKQLSFRRPVVAGANWFAVGNATGFTNPLLSPGINAGLVGAIKAAEMTAACLQAEQYADNAYTDRVLVATRREYQRFIHDYVLPRLDMLNRFWYHSFRDGRVFEATIVCFWAVGSDDRAYLSHRLGERDFEWIVGAGGAAFAQFCAEILPLIEGPGDGNPLDDAVVEQVQTTCRRWLDKMVATYPQPWSANQRHYDDRLVRIAGKTARAKGCFFLTRCSGCKYWNTPTLPKCQICGRTREP